MKYFLKWNKRWKHLSSLMYDYTNRDQWISQRYQYIANVSSLF